MHECGTNGNVWVFVQVCMYEAFGNLHPVFLTRFPCLPENNHSACTNTSANREESFLRKLQAFHSICVYITQAI